MKKLKETHNNLGGQYDRGVFLEGEILKVYMYQKNFNVKINYAIITKRCVLNAFLTTFLIAFLNAF